MDGRCCFCHLGFLEDFYCAKLQRYRGSWLQECPQTLVVSWRTVTVGNTCWVAGGWDAEHWDNLCCCSGISDHMSLSACLALWQALCDLSHWWLTETDNPSTFLQHMWRKKQKGRQTADTRGTKLMTFELPVAVLSMWNFVWMFILNDDYCETVLLLLVISWSVWNFLFRDILICMLSAFVLISCL